jgi:DNA-directed RNA polymerase specialized sigma24 family protein
MGVNPMYGLPEEALNVPDYRGVEPGWRRKYELYEALRSLTDRERTVLELRWGLEGYPLGYAEIAQILEAPIGAVWRTEAYAISKLRRMFGIVDGDLVYVPRPGSVIPTRRVRRRQSSH